jgi:hypothetical protein
MLHHTQWFVYNEKFDLLICIPYGVVIMPREGGGVQRHLEYSHHSKVDQFALSTSERQELLQLHEHHLLNHDPQTPAPESPPGLVFGRVNIEIRPT